MQARAWDATLDPLDLMPTGDSVDLQYIDLTPSGNSVNLRYIPYTER